MTTMWNIDVRLYSHLLRRLRQLQSYQGTPEELPGDDEKIEQQKRIVDAHFVDMVFHQCNMARATEVDRA